MPRARLGAFITTGLAVAIGAAMTIHSAAGEEPIGSAQMEPGGAIVLNLYRTADGIHVSAPPQRYEPSDPRYADILKHVGPLHPGETTLVKPWPEK